MKTSDFAAKLEGISLRTAYSAAAVAVARIHLMITAATHQDLLDFASQANQALLRYAREGHLDSTGAVQAQQAILSAWDAMFARWVQRFAAARREAALIGFGVLALHHERLVLPNMAKVEEREKTEGGVFDEQVQWILDAAEARSSEDALALSARIWRLDAEAKHGIQQVLLDGLENQRSAWDIATALEIYLAANEDCPRWTEERLYGLTKKAIASGNPQGLLRGDACDGGGVAYKALRLARTEIQHVHAAAIDRQMAASPWVEREQIHLTPAHPERDICDEVVEGGENGEGVYRVGTIRLPLHPHCLCYKTAVSMGEDDFVARLRDWMAGGAWPEMDAYAGFIGGNLGARLARDAAYIALGVWLFGDAETLDTRLQE